MNIIRTDVFQDWFDGLRDSRARFAIDKRIERLAEGNTGDTKPVGEGISEMRIHYGPGYRVYYKNVGKKLVILLCGGDKSAQERDISQAKELAKLFVPKEKKEKRQ
jgi:putative addiction module killer protein